MKIINILFLFILVIYGCNPCSNKDCNSGTCVEGECECNDGWSGSNCDVDLCADINCENGTCVNGICECEDNFQGTLCDEEIFCTNSCGYANDGECDDGGPNSNYNVCGCGTDCGDCGTRYGDDC
jgi:hypothetical protein